MKCAAFLPVEVDQIAGLGEHVWRGDQACKMRDQPLEEFEILNGIHLGALEVWDPAFVCFADQVQNQKVCVDKQPISPVFFDQSEDVGHYAAIWRILMEST
jgi:hypothetical protein